MKQIETVQYCHYCYFLNKGFKLRPNFSNSCHHLLRMFMNLCGIGSLDIKASDYHYNNNRIPIWPPKAEHHKTWKIYFFI